MSTTRKGGRYVLPAGADLSAKQYHIVKVTSGEVVLSSAGSDKHLGTLANAPVENDLAEVVGRHAGETAKVKAAGVINFGDKITSDASGLAVTTTTEDDEVVGIARNTTASAANDVIEYEPTQGVVPPAS